MSKRKLSTNSISLIDEEVCMGDEEFIVSKADLRGYLTYVNRIFIEMALMSEDQLINVKY